MRNQNKTPGYTRYESARTTRKTKLATLRQPNVREIKEKLVCITTGGANSKNICFGRTAKFIGESEDIAGNRKLREIIRETANNIGILHNTFGGCI